VSGSSENGSTLPEGGQKSLGEYLDAHRGETHLVVLQDYPDPDAISSAYAYQLIAEQFDINTSIVYSGKVSHQENIALVRLLNIPLTPFEPSMHLSEYDGAVFVDNQGTTSNRIVHALEEAGIPSLIIIDHHERQSRLKAEFVDIRRIGATATIFTQFLESGLVKMDQAKKKQVQVATALFHGIMTDTGNFSRAKQEDFLASAYLSHFRDADLLRQILNQSRSKQVMEVIHRALVNRVIGESYSIAGIGYLRGEDRDVIPQAADFLLTEENVHTAIVYGIITGDDSNERLIGSMRTSKLTLDPDEFIKEVLGKDARGHYFGGGKISAGGFEIPVGFLSGGEMDEYQEIKWQVFDNQIKLKLFSRIGYDPRS
jgi:nanoRNase/pAp phosphatase (c-di-AMP/oligoRNAs hydrolase)